jgi:hypothetical protein
MLRVHRYVAWSRVNKPSFLNSEMLMMKLGWRIVTECCGTSMQFLEDQSLCLVVSVQFTSVHLHAVFTLEVRLSHITSKCRTSHVVSRFGWRHLRIAHVRHEITSIKLVPTLGSAALRQHVCPPLIRDVTTWLMLCGGTCCVPGPRLRLCFVTSSA